MDGLKRAQMDLDFAPEKYKHFYLNEILDRYKSQIDVRRFSDRGAHRVFAVRGGNLRRDSGMDSRARHFQRAGLGRRLRDRGRQLRSTAGKADPIYRSWFHLARPKAGGRPIPLRQN
jgi:hypothetical protein